MDSQIEVEDPNPSPEPKLKSRDEPRFGPEEYQRKLSIAMSYATAENATDTRYWIPASPVQHYILGPCFKKGITSEVQCVYDEQGPETFPYEWESVNWSKWTSSRKTKDTNSYHAFKNWPSFSTDWVEWIDRLEPHFRTSWKTTGIDETIQSSRLPIHCDRAILAAAVYFWSSITNTFNFRFEMMTLTLIDIEAYTGLTSSDTLLTGSPSSPVSSSTPGFHKDAKNYGQFLKMNKGISSLPTEDEHIAFLLMWLCKNVFCVLASKITLQFIDIAKSLATGRPASLGPLVLTHLYLVVALISAEPYEMNPNVPGLLWILQMWLHAHFHEISPPIVEKANIPFGRQILQAGLVMHTAQECFIFFYNCKNRPQHVYHRSLHSRRYNGDSFFVIPSDVPHGDALKHFLVKKIHNMMACRDLPYCGISNKKNQCSVEVYLPSFVARQFGMYQAIPLPPASSFNGFTSDRPIIKNESEFHQYTHLYKGSQGLFELEVSTKSANSTFHFDLWWNRKTCTYFMNSASDMVSHIFPSTKIITKYVKPSYETTFISTIPAPASKTTTCSTDHNDASPSPTDSGSDSDDDTATISQAIKKKRTTTSNDASHEIDPQPVVTIGPSLAKTEMPFNSHLIIEDITKAEGNPEVDDFLVDHDPAQNSDYELALTNSKKIDAAKKVLLETVGTGFDIVTEEEARNNYRKSIVVLTDAGFFPDSMKSSISKFLHTLDEELATFNKFRENIFDAASHRSSMISLQTSIQSKASEYTTTSAKLTA
ncbi:hypothetical protein FNV43_RR24636 [Rhamnella rubrinervis]|uniref:Aminotransferase-like plant mobile domain-containing protein n=1 Tax=Rhamnella rubrinervis TaxID=2594499 RepID=A0A8K0DSY4_9ROSA|nr:hypothetical protein FNV43_RR24636 [Rhamnella rubrinervis]